METLIILPIRPDDLRKIESRVSESACFVTLLTGNIYEAVEYLNPANDFTNYKALLDRNVYTRIAALAGTAPIPAQQLNDYRWAAAVLAFCKVAEISFDYASSLHEYAHSHSGQAALDNLRDFSAADNADLQPVIDFSLGRIDILPPSTFSHSPKSSKRPPRSEFEKPITFFRWNYLFLLKIADIGRQQMNGQKRFSSFLKWMRDDFCFAAPATMWASTYFARGCPQRMLDPRSHASVSNAAWDLTLIQEWRRRAVPGQEQRNPWLLITRDKVVQSVASRLFASSDEEALNFFSVDWGKTTGKRLFKEYIEMANSLNSYSQLRNPDPWKSLPQLTASLEQWFGIT